MWCFFMYASDTGNADGIPHSEKDAVRSSLERETLFTAKADKVHNSNTSESTDTAGQILLVKVVKTDFYWSKST